jgi:pantetheine-phosphate adenylyltransferase
MKKAIYAGSFDPITNGHMWMIVQGAKLFDQLVVAVGANPEKRYTFSVQERMQMLADSVSQLVLPGKIEIAHIDNQFLVQYAGSVSAQYILRGIRNEGDYAYERGLRHINSDLRPEIVTVFLMPPREIAEVSSSLVKGMVGPEGWEAIVQRYVPTPVYLSFLKRFGSQRHRK